MRSTVRKLLRSYLLDGVLLIALGAAMLIWPESSLKALCVILGALAAVMGALRLAAYFVSKDGDRSAADLLSGVLQLILGVALIAASDFFITVFQYVVAICLAYGAILLFRQVLALRAAGGPTLILALVFAVLTAILAVVIFLNPAAFAAFMTQLEGVSLIVEGVGMILVLRQFQRDVRGL